MTLRGPDWDVARAAAFDVGARLPTECLPTSSADGRVLAEPVRALTSLPPRSASAMDGWAVSGAGPWTVVGDLRAGDLHDRPLAPGEAVAIATGGALPAGTLGVLRQEHGARAGDGRLVGVVVADQDVRPAGEEAGLGDVLIASGTRLNPAHLGLAAAAGHDSLAVVRRARAKVLVLGDELLAAGPSRDGRIRDSLGPQLPGWLRRLGVDVVSVDWIADTLEAHVDALAACGDVDVVVTSGGTAAGPVDFVRRALKRSGGDVVVDTVAVRPGHPMLLGRWTDRWLIGLPGNPQAAVVALMTLGAPLIEALAGRRLPELPVRRLAAAVVSRGDRTRLVACTDDGQACTPAEFIGSGMLRGLADADGFAVVGHGNGAIGEVVPWLPLP